MKNWTTPQLKELDVRMTAKTPGVIEMESEIVDGYFLPATWNVFEGLNPGPTAGPKETLRS